MVQLLDSGEETDASRADADDPYPFALPQSSDLEQRRRWTRDDWVVYGLLTLERRGIHAVRIEEMARRSGRTPGSFYGYFASRDALLDAMIADWQRRRVAQIEWTHRQLKRQGRYTLSGVVDDFMVRIKGEWVRPNLDMAMRVWARQDPRVRPAVHAIDELRLVNASAMVRAEHPATHDAPEIAVLLNWILAGRHILFVDPANRATSRAAERAIGRFLELVAAEAKASEAVPGKPPVARVVASKRRAKR